MDKPYYIRQAIDLREAGQPEAAESIERIIRAMDYHENPSPAYEDGEYGAARDIISILTGEAPG